MLPPRRHAISRIEGFSGAVVAFALALLVVSLEIAASYEDLVRPMTGFAPFAASFALLAWIGYEHNVFFRTYPAAYPVHVGVRADPAGPRRHPVAHAGPTRAHLCDLWRRAGRAARAAASRAAGQYRVLPRGTRAHGG
jgi:hypothetical protein